MTGHRPITLITGASSGIGLALAREFSRHGHELVLVARRRDRLESLAGEIAATGARRPIVIVANLEKPDAVELIAAALQANAVEPQYVVNNAGFALIGRAAELDRDAQLAIIDLNVRALTALSLAFVDSLARHKGGILNVGSIAGFLPGPGMAVYYASKAYVLSFSQALHQELKPRGVRVTALCPGTVPTEFGARAGFAAIGTPKLLTMSAEKVAEQGYRDLMAGRRVTVPGFLTRLITVIMPFVPKALTLGTTDRAMVARQAVRAPEYPMGKSQRTG
jgi:short-subunit dehydrogenase